MADTEHMKATMRRYAELFNAGDHVAVADLYADGAVIEDPVGKPPVEGRAAIEKFYADSIAAGAKLTAHEVRGSYGDRSAMRFSADLPGLHIDGIEVMTFDEDGKVVRMEAFWGPGDFLTT
ncbi:nuclear transport factor 2 family protein [Actinomadura rupiterrae]|uniref:nuclear transport factor 2 family protein n=1 Tax=Actinomadura rupiterrae TaxID=559627 RepID=UPI0020A29AAB|nr:nuclear transport factor 2 family protein [Actinomadura rupiterrae]MCP2335643.1 steroid delta-isomerase [Actinomadura rupiterrae]